MRVAGQTSTLVLVGTRRWPSLNDVRLKTEYPDFRQRFRKSPSLLRFLFFDADQESKP